MIRNNRLNIQFAHNNILNDFVIVKFKTTEKYISNGTLFLDELPSKLKALSIVFSGDLGEKELFTLFNKNDFSKISLSTELNQIDKGDVLTFEKLNTEDAIQNVPTHTLAQLLINSLVAPKNERLSFSNLSGHFYSFHKNNFKKNRKEITTQIIGLQYKINKDLELELNVKTFTNLILKNKLSFTKKMPLHKYPKYVLSHATKSIRRKLSDDNSNSDVFIIKQFKNKKNIIPFINFTSFKDFNASKMGALMSLKHNIEKKLSNYLSFSFKEVKEYKAERYNRLISKEKESSINSICRDYTLNFVDTINDDFSNEWIKKTSKEFLKFYVFNKIIFNKSPKENYLNIRVIHNKEHYKKYNQTDLHLVDKKHITHNLTIEDFEVSKASINTVIKELLIKKDIIEKCISLIDWEQFNFKKKWIFGNKVNDLFYFISINPNGKINFTQFEPDLFNQSEFDKYYQIFEEDKNVEGIIINDKNEINTILKTNSITIPKFEEIYNILEKENEYFTLTKNELLNCIDKSEINQERKTKYLTEINNSEIEAYTRENILTLVTQRNDRKILSNCILSEKGVLLRAYLKDKKRYEILASNLDIITYNENDNLYYFVGTKGEGIQSQIARASRIRKIKALSNDNLFFNQLVPLMNVDFVKNGDLTVKPFPFKYLEEWIKIR